jgi:hypothetical protein
MISTGTFRDEFDFLDQHVPEALYADWNDPINTFFTSTLLEWVRENQYQLEDDYHIARFAELTLENDFQERSDWITSIDVDEFMNSLAQSDWDEDRFEEVFSHYFGFSAYQAYRYFSGRSMSLRLANLVTNFGKDAFGCYLPMHAFYKSASTPWGIYLFPELIIEQATQLHCEINEGLQWWEHIVFYLYAVYRHELFHSQVERFATRLEMLFNRAFYKPYRLNVSNEVCNSEDWLEEALAENSVLNSRLVANRTGISGKMFRKIYEHDLQNMPPGYRDYHCQSHGGPELAMRKFTAQVASGTVEPDRHPTNLMTIRTEYAYPDQRVPGYFAIDPEIKRRFQ